MQLFLIFIFLFSNFEANAYESPSRWSRCVLAGGADLLHIMEFQKDGTLVELHLFSDPHPKNKCSGEKKLLVHRKWTHRLQGEKIETKLIKTMARVFDDSIAKNVSEEKLCQRSDWVANKDMDCSNGLRYAFEEKVSHVRIFTKDLVDKSLTLVPSDFLWDKWIFNSSK